MTFVQWLQLFFCDIDMPRLAESCRNWRVAMAFSRFRQPRPSSDGTKEHGSWIPCDGCFSHILGPAFAVPLRPLEVLPSPEVDCLASLF